MDIMRIKLVLVFVVLLLAACAPGELEPPAEGLPVTRQTALPPEEATATAAMALIQTAAPTRTPFESPTADLTATPTLDGPSATPPLTIPATEGPPPTMTPVPPFPGFRYQTEAGTWQVDAGWQPQLVTERTDVVLSPDGTQGLYVEEGDIWLLDVAGGGRENLTGDSGRYHCCPLWWPERPGTVLFGSWPSEDVGPSSGFLSVVQTDGSGYEVLAEGESNAEPDPAPDGRRIAYDVGGTAWIYNFETGESSQLDPAFYGLENIERIAGPSWSPDGHKLAWTIAATIPEWRIAVLLFDLETGMVQLFHVYENIGRGGWFPGPAWHPDGEWLAFVAEDVDPEQFGVWAVNVVTGEEAHIGRGVNPVWSPDGEWLAYQQYTSINSGDIVPKLVEFESWYHINLWIPDGGMLLEWVMPG